MTPPPAATTTSRNVPHISLKSRRYSNRGLSKFAASSARERNRSPSHRSTGSPLEPVGMLSLMVLTVAERSSVGKHRRRVSAKITIRSSGDGRPHAGKYDQGLVKESLCAALL